MDIKLIAKLLLVKTQQPVEKPLYASCGSPLKAQRTHHCSVFGLDI
jgi:hypothetical protein